MASKAALGSSHWPDLARPPLYYLPQGQKQEKSDDNQTFHQHSIEQLTAIKTWPYRVTYLTLQPPRKISEMIVITIAIL